MRYRNTIIALGILTIVVPFLGFPQSWYRGIYAVVGLFIIALAYVGERR